MDEKHEIIGMVHDLSPKKRDFTKRFLSFLEDLQGMDQMEAATEALKDQMIEFDDLRDGIYEIEEIELDLLILLGIKNKVEYLSVFRKHSRLEEPIINKEFEKEFLDAAKSEDGVNKSLDKMINKLKTKWSALSMHQ